MSEIERLVVRLRNLTKEIRWVDCCTSEELKRESKNHRKVCGANTSQPDITFAVPWHELHSLPRIFFKPRSQGNFSRTILSFITFLLLNSHHFFHSFQVPSCPYSQVFPINHQPFLLWKTPSSLYIAPRVAAKKKGYGQCSVKNHHFGAVDEKNGKDQSHLNEDLIFPIFRPWREQRRSDSSRKWRHQMGRWEGQQRVKWRIVQ